MSASDVDVCYLLSHGFAARMVLQTDVIPRIRERGMTVAMILPSSGERAAEEIRRRYGLEVRVAPDYESGSRREYQILRRYMFEDVEENPSLWAKHHYSRDQSTQRKLILDAYLLLNKLSLKSKTVRDRLRRLEYRLLESPEARAILRDLEPKLVVATYPVSRLEAALVKESEKMGITTVGHLLSWDNITSKGRFPSPPDYYITWGPIMSSEVREYYGKSDDAIHECGVAHFDRHLEAIPPERIHSILTEHGLNPDWPFMFFGMSSPYIAPREIDVVTWLAEQVGKNRFGERMQLLVRPHPQNVTHLAGDSWVDRLAEITGPRVAINYPEIKDDGLNWSMQESDFERLITLFRGSSITLNSGSTFAIDGLMHDKPVIITAFDGDAELSWYRSANRILNFHHIRKLLAYGGCFVAESYQSLAAGIDRYLADPRVDAEKRETTRHAECGPCDGRTAERIAAALESIIEKTAKDERADRVAEEEEVS